MSRPWMPLYVADYRVDTAHLSAAQHGGYLLLIMHYWTAGGLPEDDGALARIACMTAAEWRKHKPVLAAFFQDGWHHKRIDRELAKAADVSSKRRASAMQMHSKISASAPANAEQLHPHARTYAGASLSQSQSQKKEPSLRSGETRMRACVWPFDEFWRTYPHKVGKQGALKAFQRVERAGEISFENLMLGLHRYVTKTDDRPWCNPQTWLNEGRWEDQPAQQQDRRNGQVSGNHRTSSADAILAGAANLARRRFGNMPVAGRADEIHAAERSEDLRRGANADGTAFEPNRAGDKPEQPGPGNVLEGEIIGPDEDAPGLFGRVKQ